MKTLQDDWKIYRDACYPKGCSAIQNKECHQAFFAGALMALNASVALSVGTDEEQAAKAFGLLIKEAEQVLMDRGSQLKRKN